MKTKIITINLNCKSSADFDLAFDEAVKKIKAGYLLGRDDNDSAGYSFGVKNETTVIDAEDITDEAKHIANQLRNVTEGQLREFAVLSQDGLNLESFGEFIDGNLASMIQVMIDELGGIDSGRDEEVAEKLSKFLELDSPLTVLQEVSSLRP